MQSKRASLTEALSNVACGALINWCAAWAILPAFGYDASTGRVTGITLCYTALAIVRSYVVRRIWSRL